MAVLGALDVADISNILLNIVVTSLWLDVGHMYGHIADEARRRAGEINGKLCER